MQYLLNENFLTLIGVIIAALTALFRYIFWKRKAVRNEGTFILNKEIDSDIAIKKYIESINEKKNKKSELIKYFKVSFNLLKRYIDEHREMIDQASDLLNNYSLIVPYFQTTIEELKVKNIELNDMIEKIKKEKDYAQIISLITLYEYKMNLLVQNHEQYLRNILNNPINMLAFQTQQWNENYKKFKYDKKVQF